MYVHYFNKNNMDRIKFTMQKKRHKNERQNKKIKKVE